MELEPQDVAQLTEALNGAVKAINRFSGNSNAVSNSNFYVQAGGALVMVLLFAAAFVLGVALDTSYSLHTEMAKMQQRQDRQDDYLNAIYMMAPSLKPKEKTDERPNK